MLLPDFLQLLPAAAFGERKKIALQPKLELKFVLLVVFVVDSQSDELQVQVIRVKTVLFTFFF